MRINTEASQDPTSKTNGDIGVSVVKRNNPLSEKHWPGKHLIPPVLFESNSDKLPFFGIGKSKEDTELYSSSIPKAHFVFNNGIRTHTPVSDEEKILQSEVPMF